MAMTGDLLTIEEVNDKLGARRDRIDQHQIDDENDQNESALVTYRKSRKAMCPKCGEYGCDRRCDSRRLEYENTNIKEENLIPETVPHLKIGGSLIKVAKGKKLLLMTLCHINANIVANGVMR